MVIHLRVNFISRSGRLHDHVFVCTIFRDSAGQSPTADPPPPPLIGNNQSAESEPRKLVYSTDGATKPTEAMPAYQILGFPTYRPPPQISLSDNPKSGRSNKTPKMGDARKQSDTRGKEHPHLTWDGGVPLNKSWTPKKT